MPQTAIVPLLWHNYDIIMNNIMTNALTKIGPRPCVNSCFVTKYKSVLQLMCSWQLVDLEATFLQQLHLECFKNTFWVS